MEKKTTPRRAANDALNPLKGEQLRKCESPGCGNPRASSIAKYCSARCRSRVFQARKSAAKTLAKTTPTEIRRGDCYRVIADLNLYQAWADNTLTYKGVRDELEGAGFTFSLQAVIAALQAARIDIRLRDTDWVMDERTKKMLMLHRPPPESADLLDDWLDEAVAAFLAFEAAFFRTPKRKPYMRKPFHVRWIRATVKAIVTGGRLCIVCAPRHGKTELFIHFCVWSICRDFDVRIIWIAPNQKDQGEEALGAVRSMLEDNAALRAAVLPKWETFAPLGRRSSNWSADSITVKCRTAVGNKAPTMCTIGRRGKILSKDADLVIMDDIEDFDSTDSPTEREKTRKWAYSNVGSRKEEHTAWLYACSRQHDNDLASHLMEDEEWEVITDSAHDSTCPLDPENEEIHTECMAFAEHNSYRWLSQNRRSAIAQGLEEHFNMVYLAQVTAEGRKFWTRDGIRPAYNPARPVGLEWFGGKDNHVLRLVAGLDPSAVKHQAGFIWGADLYAPQYREYMIDLDNHLGGGLDPFIELAEYWYDLYALRHWVVEITMYRTGFLTEPRLVRWATEREIIIEPHDTQGRTTASTVGKHDRWYGVGAMREKYVLDPVTGLPTIDLPTGDADARYKTELYTSQMLSFTDDASRLRKRTTDVLMSSWFPQKVLRRWRAEMSAENEPQGDEFEPSFGGYDVSDYGDAPW